MANPPMTDNDIAAVASAAVIGERERCAKVAENFYLSAGEKDAPTFRMKTIGECIAFSIRKR